MNISFKAEIDGQSLEISLRPNGDCFDVLLEKGGQEMDCRQLSPHTYSFIIDNRSALLIIEKKSRGLEITLDHQKYHLLLKDEMQQMLDKMGIKSEELAQDKKIIATIPGLIRKIETRPGELVTAGQGLMIVEAMKMENELKSPVSGIVKSVFVSEGQSIEKGDLLVELE
ncbi:MAG TPA: acetyl-CoA carboxylase biotin carboxyl carrier protein subunit [Candidatus Marinimicrobia bacterium]|nr:acetyl-CoA carboxylase biotin carboxyl carrier protein subunit [Candidatus Neomarinimicrobiota bacterium]